MLETIREYALEQLEKSRAVEAIRRRHAAHYLVVAEAAASQLRGRDQLVWWKQLEIEHNNLRAALRWCAASGDAEHSLRLGTALGQFWNLRGYLSEGRRWLEDALALSNDSSAAVRAAAHLQAAWLAHDQMDNERALALGQESLTLYRALDDNLGIAKVLHFFGSAAGLAGDQQQAVALLEESLALYQASGDRMGISEVFCALGYRAFEQQDYGQAYSYFTDSIALSREQGSMLTTAWALAGMSDLAHEQGDDQQSLASGKESLALFREHEDVHDMAWMLLSLGHVALAQAEYAQALAWFAESLGYFQRQGLTGGVAACLFQFACTAVAQQQLDRAARLFAAAEVFVATPGMRLDNHSRAEFDRMEVSLRDQLNHMVYEAAWVEVQAMTLEQAIAYALGSGDEPI
jgi:tetratricopeptide (TPR) repeat protein